MGQTCTDLYQFSNKFNQSISQGKISKLDILYISMNNMLVQWGNNLTAQIKIVQEELCSFFKFHHHSITSLKEFIKQKEQAQQEYEKFKSKLELKKHKLFAQQDFNRWEVPSIQIKALQDSNLTQNREVCLAIMLPQETTLQEELKNIFAFYNYQQFSEVNSHLEKTVTAFSEHFIKFCSQQKEMLAEVLSNYKAMFFQKIDCVIEDLLFQSTILYSLNQLAKISMGQEHCQFQQFTLPTINYIKENLNIYK